METKEMTSVKQAFDEGKQIEFSEKGRDEWCDIPTPHWRWEKYDYRVKPEPKLRPYTFDELQAEMAKGKIVVKRINLKGINRILTITRVSDEFYEDEKIRLSEIRLSDWNKISYKTFLENYQWLDGSPCGVLIKQ